jgi:predicted AAA+ superfamily ATPase
MSAKYVTVRHMITRTLGLKLATMAQQFPVVTLTGPRQSGKTTLCRMIFPDHRYVSLEAPDIRRFALKDPRGFLEQFAPPVVIDEVQRAPELLSYIQVAVDEKPKAGQFVLTGSANFALLETVTQSLAGRTAVAHLLPCEHRELLSFANAPTALFDTIQIGAYPAIFDRGIDPLDWYRGYITTTLERDIREIVNVGDLVTFQTFLELTAGRIGQLTNLSQLGADTGINANTAKAWLSVLETGFLVFRLRPFHANLRSRSVKTPKLYFYDTGLACALLGISETSQLYSHPLRGALFENWVVSEVLKARLHRGLHGACYFLRDRKGFEVDLFLDVGDRLIATEIKSGQTVAGDFFTNLEKLMRWQPTVLDDRSLEARVVYGGSQRQQRRTVDVIPWNEIKDLTW